MARTDFWIKPAGYCARTHERLWEIEFTPSGIVRGRRGTYGEALRFARLFHALFLRPRFDQRKAA